MYYAKISKILEAKRFYAANPEGVLYIGFSFGYWNKADFYSWFHKCLNIKCGGSELNQKDIDWKCDQRIVADYKRGARHPGRNIFRSELFRKMYPHINNQTIES